MNKAKMQTVSSNGIRGMCRFCLAKGNHQHVCDVVYAETFAECLNLFLVTDFRLTQLMCDACVTFIRDVKRFRNMVAGSEKQLLRTVQNETVCADVPAESASHNDSVIKEDMNPVKTEPIDDYLNSSLCAETMLSDAVAAVTVPLEVASHNEWDMKMNPVKTEKPNDDHWNSSFSAEIMLSDATGAVTGVDSENIKVKIETIVDEESDDSSAELKFVNAPKNEIPCFNQSITVTKKTLSGKLIFEPEMNLIPVKDMTGENESKMQARIIAIPNFKIATSESSATERKGAPKCKSSNNSVKQVESSTSELTKHLQNLRTILLNTNATPIMTYTDLGYLCYFCNLCYPDIRELKNHTLETHSNPDLKDLDKRKGIKEFCIKLDITDLRCNLCLREIETFESLVTHLTADHEMKMWMDIKNHILPLKYNNNSFDCVICHERFDRLKLIRDHMNVHYTNFVCDICSATFVTQGQYKVHNIRYHECVTVECSFCSKVFDSIHKKRNHEKIVHSGHKPYKCLYCDEKFSQYQPKMKHMETVHGTERREFKCNACNNLYKTQKSLTAHTKRDHLVERAHKCNQCHKSFDQSSMLNNHMLKHARKKEFQCKICNKWYVKKFTLQEHMKIHLNDRKFKCDICGKAFVQKFSWKSHMLSAHGETV